MEHTFSVYLHFDCRPLLEDYPPVNHVSTQNNSPVAELHSLDLGVGIPNLQPHYPYFLISVSPFLGFQGLGKKYNRN